MSTLSTVGLGLGINALNAVVSELVLINPRFIGPFVADVTIEERGEDRMVVTKHPVEQGAAVADHAYKLPATLHIRGAYSSSSIFALGDPLYVNTAYQNFLALQASRTLFSIQTGKRLYVNMFMTDLIVVTDEKTEYALMFEMMCEELLLTSTQTVVVPPTGNMANPASTGAPVQRGTVPLTTGNSWNANTVIQ